jgi:hypothetical protein
MSFPLTFIIALCHTGKKSGWPWPFGVGQQQDRCIGQLKLDTVLSASSQEPIVLYPNSKFQRRKSQKRKFKEEAGKSSHNW